MTVALVWDPALASYRFPRHHPMRPERFSLAVDLMREWDLLDEPGGTGRSRSGEEHVRARTWAPAPAPVEELLLFHTREYVDAVMAASADPTREAEDMGLGPGDTPVFAGMHEAAALAVGSTTLALDAVLKGRTTRAFNPAGGLHHAMPGRAAGFCIYNDCAIAIERATRSRRGLHVAYVDIDAHHGDGVQAAFYDRADVLTLSVHESGRFLFPGTGDIDDIGTGPGVGACINVPLPPGAGPESYALVMHDVIAPALRHFRPDVIVAQLGGDTHVGDPLTHLTQTVAGHVDMARHIVGLSDKLCEGRLVAVGGGGYQPFSVVPRMWALTMAVLMSSEVPVDVPLEWMDEAVRAASHAGVALQRVTDPLDDREGVADLGTFTDRPGEGDPEPLGATHQVIDRVRRASLLIGHGH